MNILVEFTKKDETVKDKIIDDLEKHVESNWYRLVDYQRKDDKVRIYSTYRDIKDVLSCFSHGYGSLYLKYTIIEDNNQ
jgi:hypothetical protein